MNGICIVGAAKTGTTGAYAAVRDGLVRSGRDFYSLFEKYWERQYRSLWRHAPNHTILSKMLLTNPGFSAPLAGEFDRRVLLVRDPRDTLVSTVLYFPVVAVNAGADDQTIEGFVAMVEQKEDDPDSVSIRDLLGTLHQMTGAPHPDADFSGRFGQTVNFADTTQAHLLSYEDLVADQLQELGDYLSLDLRTRRSNQFTDLIFRRGGSGDWCNWFTHSDVEHYRPLLQPYMQRFGYPDRWELTPDPLLDPDDGSGYIRRSCQQRREQSAVRTARGTISDRRMRLLRDRADDGAQRDARELARILIDDPSLAETPSEPFDRALFVARGGDYRGMKLVRRCLDEGIGTAPSPDEAAWWANEMVLEGSRVDTERDRDTIRNQLEQSRREAAALRREIQLIKGSRRYAVGGQIARTAHRVRSVVRTPLAMTRRRRPAPGSGSGS